MYINFYQLKERLVETGVSIEAGESDLEFAQYKLCQLHIKCFAFVIEDHWFPDRTIVASFLSLSWYGSTTVWSS